MAQDIAYNRPGEDPQPYAYEPLAQRFSSNVSLIVRAHGEPKDVLQAVQREVRSMALSLFMVAGTVPERLDIALWGPRAGASLLAVFGLLALVLASVGIYGVMSYSVTQRSREIGVRMAIGARQRDVLRLVLRQGLTLVAAGLGLGLLLAFGVTRFAAGLLFGVTPTDPVAFGTTSAVLLLVAFTATLVPALKATSVNPSVALRAQ